MTPSDASTVGTSGSGSKETRREECPPRWALSVRGLDKRFPGVHAVRGVSLDVGPGQVRGLVGENGAGKSTVIKMIAGACAQDEGAVVVDGRAVPHGSVRAAASAGIVAVHQDAQIVPGLSAADNALLTRLPDRAGFVSRRAGHRRFTEWCSAIGAEIPADQPAGELGLGQQQLLQVIRALDRRGKVILMDEPTAGLGPKELDALMRAIRRFREQGSAILFVSHNLEEVLSICDEVTVMRDGRVVSSRSSAAETSDSLITAMLGEKLGQTLERRLGRHVQRTAGTHAPQLLRASGVSVPDRIEGIDLVLHAGEILGIAGLAGSGRTRLLRALAGNEPTSRGALFMDGDQRPWPTTPRQAFRLGIALATENRRAEGLALSLSGAENVALPRLARTRRLSVARKTSLRRWATDVCGAVRFPPERLGARAGTLSGGTQQKLVLAKLLAIKPRVLLVDEPFRGIDVGAKAEIIELLARLASQGIGIVMASEDTEELVGMSDRIIVLQQGRATKELRGADVELGRVVKEMFPEGDSESA